MNTQYNPASFDDVLTLIHKVNSVVYGVDNRTVDDGRRFHNMGDFDERHDDEDRMEAAADDEMDHREYPSDEEIDAMFEASQTDHEVNNLAN